MTINQLVIRIVFNILFHVYDNQAGLFINVFVSYTKGAISLLNESSFAYHYTYTGAEIFLQKKKNSLQQRCLYSGATTQQQQPKQQQQQQQQRFIVVATPTLISRPNSTPQPPSTSPLYLRKQWLGIVLQLVWNQGCDSSHFR